MPTFGIAQSYSDFGSIDASKSLPSINVLPSSDPFLIAEPSPEEMSPSDGGSGMVADIEESLEMTQTQTQNDSQSQEDLDLNSLIGILTYTNNGTDYYLLKNNTSHVWNIGRNVGNWVVINDSSVSQKHCYLSWNGELGDKCEIQITDDSKNGTIIDGVLKLGGKYKDRRTSIISSGTAIQINGAHMKHFYLYRDIEAIKHKGRHSIHQKYTIGKLLGNGAFASVYRCVEIGTSKSYAVKVIEKSKVKRMNGDEGSLTREIAILKHLCEFKHENIVGLIDHYEEEDAIYLVLELVEGGDLLTYTMDRYDAKDYLTEDEVCRMAAQICQAVAYIHTRGITHRDLKPENILLTRSNPPICKVADFGLSKIMGNKTFMKTLCGTPAYLAPEVMTRYDKENTPYDNKVDSFSLGVIFFCMLTGQVPFDSVFDDKLKGHERENHFRDRKVVWPVLTQMQVSSQGEKFVRRLLEYEPRNRMSVAEALDHPWISCYVPSYSRVLYPNSSEGDALDDSVIPSSPNEDHINGPCSQDMQKLNLSDMSIPGLGDNGGTMDYDQGPSQITSQGSSVTSRIPGAFPKDAKQPLAPLPPIIEAVSIPLKRKKTYLNDSDSLSSMSEDEDVAPATAPQPPKPNLRRKPNPVVIRPLPKRASQPRKAAPAPALRAPTSRRAAALAVQPVAESSTTRRVTRGVKAQKRS